MVDHVVPVPIRRIIAKAVIEPSNKTFLCLVPPPDIILPYLQYDKLFVLYARRVKLVKQRQQTYLDKNRYIIISQAENFAILKLDSISRLINNRCIVSCKTIYSDETN